MRPFAPAPSLLVVALLLAACGDNGSGNGGDSSVSDFETAHFSGAENCALCHDGLTGTSGDFGFVADWQSTLMANAARDPLWQAKMASEVARNPELSATIQDKCARCHTPMAYTENHFQGKETTLLAADEGVLSSDHSLHAAARGGVSCTLCHQIQNEKLGNNQTFSGEYVIKELSGLDRILFGPIRLAVTRPMQNRVGFTPRQGGHMQNAGLCATCHNLKTTVVDPDSGTAAEPVQKFPEQAVYTEWANSTYASGNGMQTCQQCHMPTTDDAALATRPRGLPTRGGVSQHHFVGGNAYMLDLFRNNRDLLGIAASDAALERTLARTEAMLESAAGLEIANIRSGDPLRFDITVTNNSGHKLPTSFPSRRVWLHIQVLNADGNVLFESGKPHEDGRIAGVGADQNAANYEHHHDTITKSEQVAVWEPIMEDLNGEVTYTLMEGADYTKDNRILAAGMTKGALPGEVATHGDARSDPDFQAGSDTVHYDIAPGGTAARIRARLHYQSVSYRFRRDLVTGTGKEAAPVARYQKAHAKSERTFETLATLEKAVP